MMNKVETVAMLLNGGVSESDLLKLPNVRRKDIDKAKDILQRAFTGFNREMEEYVQSVKHKMQGQILTEESHG